MTNCLQYVSLREPIVLKPSETQGCPCFVYLQCPEPGCAWAFTTAYKLKRHEESHGGKKEYIVSCLRIERDLNVPSLIQLVSTTVS